MLDFSFDKPVQRQDFFDQLPQSWQHRRRQNRTAGELLSGTTWTLEMRDDVSNLIYAPYTIYIAWQSHKSLPCETFYTLCFIVFFSSSCPTLKHSSLLSPIIPQPVRMCFHLVKKLNSSFHNLSRHRSIRSVVCEHWKKMVHSRFPYCVLYHISWNTVSGVGQSTILTPHTPSPRPSSKIWLRQPFTGVGLG